MYNNNLPLTNIVHLNVLLPQFDNLRNNRRPVRDALDGTDLPTLCLSGTLTYNQIHSPQTMTHFQFLNLIYHYPLCCLDSNEEIYKVYY